MTDSEADRREAAEPPAPEPAPEEEPPAEDDEDARVDRDVEETFPASDPPGNY